MSNDRRGPDFGVQTAGFLTDIAAAVVFGWYANRQLQDELKRLAEQRKLKLPQVLESSHQEPIIYTSAKRDVAADAVQLWDGVRRQWVQFPNRFKFRALALIVAVTLFVFGIFEPYSVALGILMGGGVAFGISFSIWMIFSPSPGSTAVDTTESEKLAPPKKPRIRLIQRTYSVTMPQKTEWRPIHATEFMATLLAQFTGLAFQIEATHEHISWRIIDLRCNANPNDLQRVIHSIYPEAEITWSDDLPVRNGTHFYRHVMHFEHQTDFFEPMKHAENLKQFDPLIALAAEMTALQPGERIVYSLYVADFARFAHDQTLNFLVRDVPKNPMRYVGTQGLFRAIAEQGLPPELDLLYSEAETKLFLSKLMSPMYLSFLMVQVDASTCERVLALAHTDSHFVHLDNIPYNGVRSWKAPSVKTVLEVNTPEQDAATSIEGIIERWVNEERRDWRWHPLILDAPELASLWHLPYMGFLEPKIEWISGIHVSVPRTLIGHHQGVCLGDGRYLGRKEPVYLPDSNRMTHMLIIGKPGVGKSNLMRSMIQQDIEQRKSVVVIDPHGALVQDILRWSIPPEREKDVVVLDLANRLFPPPLNPMRGLEGEVAVARTVDILHKLYPDLKELAQTADALENAILTLQVYPDATLWDVDRLFSDDQFRRSLLKQHTNPVLFRFWYNEYERLPLAQQTQVSAPITRRIRRFYRIPALRAIICHKDGIDFAGLVRQNKIILISLRAEESVIAQQEQRLIGALLISRLQMAAWSNAFLENPCYCYVDELQNFTTTSIDEIFSGARKFQLSMTLAHQYLQQLKGEALEAAMGTIDTLAVFQVGAQDGRALAPYTRPSFDMDELTKLNKYTMALWMRSVEQRETAFTVTTRPPVPLPDQAREPKRMAEGRERERRIREKSIASYTSTSVDEVLTWLHGRDNPSKPDNDDWYDETKT